MTLSCPGCHAKHKFKDDIAVDRTVYVKCPACSHMMMISPKINNPATMTPRPEAEKSAAPALPPEIAAAIAAARASLWRVDALELSREELDTSQVAEQIGKGTIDADTLIAHVDRNDWQRIGDVDELRQVLGKRSPAPPPGPAPRSPAAAAPSAAPEPPRPPFTTELGSVVTYPLRGKGPLLLLVGALFLAMASISVPALTLLIVDLLFAVVVLRDSASGRHQIPGLDAFTDLADLFVTMLKVAAVTAVAFLPLILLDSAIVWGPLRALQGPTTDELVAATSLLPVQRIGGVGLVASCVVGLLVMLYYPMCLVIAVAFDSALLGISPGLVIGSMRTLGATYAIADGVSIVIVGLATTATVAVGMATGPTAWLAAIAGAVAVVYLLMCMLYMLGRMVNENAGKLGWAEEGGAR